MTDKLALDQGLRATVIIVTYRRLEALKLSVESAVSQDYRNKEIIVVDNCSGDATAEWLRTNYPAVRVLDLPTNGGACSGRNAGIRVATGDIIVTMDDDVYFDSPSELTKLASIFEHRPDVHVIACQLLDQATGEIRDREWCHPRSRAEFGNKEFETNFFVEGAAAFRRCVFETVGLFYEPMFVGCEGHDLVLRLFNYGFRIRYIPQFRMHHLMSHRAAQRPYYLYTRNYIWLAYKHYSLWPGLKFLVPKLGMMFLFSIRAHCLNAYLRGLADGIRGLRRVRSERTPVKSTTLEYFSALDKFRPGFLTRLSRHRTQTQL